MHALILAIILGSSAHADQLLLEVRLQRHLSASWTKLYQEKKGWRCETELTKHFYLEKKPDALGMLPLAKATRDTCEEKVAIGSTKPKQKWNGCADDLAVKEFLRVLARDCGR